MRYNLLIKSILILFLLWLFFAGLYYGKPFLVPVTVAAIISMLLWPVAKKMESWGLNQRLADLLAVVAFVGLVAGIGLLLSSQIQSFASDLPKIKEKVMSSVHKVEQYVQDQFGISQKKQEKLVKQQGSDKATSMSKAVVSSTLATIADFLLVLVYTFLFLLYRQKFKNFILKYTPEDRQEETTKVIRETARVSLQYLGGRIILILFLAILYAIGLSIIGIKNAIFFSVLAALFSLIPYIGNILGGFFPFAMSIINQGTNAAIGVIVIFTIIQLVENYILEPVIIGNKTNVNPLFVIGSIIVGELLWGVAGMIVAVPLVAIFKIIFDHIHKLQPVGYLIGDTSKDGEGNFTDKIGNKIKGLFKH